MCRHFREDFGLETRIARFHNVYGSFGIYKGGREKAPAAICRKVIEAKLTNNQRIEIWGDGKQTRSFTYIDDCIKGIQDIMFSEITEPVNLGSSEMVTVNQLVDTIEEIAGIRLKRNYNLSAPKGVNGRNSDNTLIKHHLAWEPNTKLRIGLEKTYQWIYEQMAKEFNIKTKVSLPNESERFSSKQSSSSNKSVKLDKEINKDIKQPNLLTQPS
ncbi:MAG: NAD-dependent epimerase/dehydratase [uncultured bacterium]|nr:MAG: NAD-dependent epimerase/dehydratase [uncultured bacterium]